MPKVAKVVVGYGSQKSRELRTRKPKIDHPAKATVVVASVKGTRKTGISAKLEAMVVDDRSVPTAGAAASSTFPLSEIPENIPNSPVAPVVRRSKKRKAIVIDAGGRRAAKKRKAAAAAAAAKLAEENLSGFTFVSSAKEDHGKIIYGCQLNHLLKEGEPLILATVGSNRVSIYECCPDGRFIILQVYEDPDEKEVFYCCAWTDDGTGKPWLVAAGLRGIIRLFAPEIGSCTKHFPGHGGAINDLTFHPQDIHLLVSASKDHSVRMWNVKTGVLVAIFGDVDGHRDEVVAIDIDISGSRMVSGGLDHCLKVWNLKTPTLRKAIARSKTHNSNYRTFHTLMVHFPDFSTREIHGNYIDCAKWFGDFILSKSCENSIVCWKGGKAFQNWSEVNTETKDIALIHRLTVEDCTCWYIRFSMDFWKRTLALGTQIGKTYLYEIGDGETSEIRTSILSHPKCKRTIRQTTFSRDGKVLICVSDDSTIWRWDNKDE